MVLLVQIITIIVMGVIDLDRTRQLVISFSPLSYQIRAKWAPIFPSKSAIFTLIMTIMSAYHPIQVWQPIRSECWFPVYVSTNIHFLSARPHLHMCRLQTCLATRFCESHSEISKCWVGVVSSDMASCQVIFAFWHESNCQLKKPRNVPWH